MLFDPNMMPEFKKRKKPKDKGLDSLYKESDMRQKPLSKHNQPSTYVETKVEKRKS